MNRKVFWQLVVLTVIAVVVISGIREFVARPFIVSGDSMTPMLMSNDYLVIDELTYYFHKPQRGDIIIFRYPLDPSTFYIKRLIGVPGDTVNIIDGAVSVLPQGSSAAQLLVEPYVSAGNRKKETSTITLGDDEYFVLGDNREASFDSRVWGPVPGRYIIGRPIVRLFPFQDFTVLPGEHHFDLAGGTSTLSTVK